MKLNYPRGGDVEKAVLKAVLEGLALTPQELYEAVLSLLEAEGFYCRHLNVKRVWRVYEGLVRRGRMPDWYGVVRE